MDIDTPFTRSVGATTRYTRFQGGASLIELPANRSCESNIEDGEDRILDSSNVLILVYSKFGIVAANIS